MRGNGNGPSSCPRASRGLAMRLSLVAAAQDIDRLRWKELVPKVAGHLLLVRELVAHDEDLTTKAVHFMGVNE